MIITTTLWLAVREIRRNSTRSLLTGLGIVIGVAAVITLVTVGQGATRQVTGDITKLGTNLLIVAPGSDRRGPLNASAPALTLADARAIATEVPAAAQVAPSVNRNALAVAGNANYNTVVTGTTRAFFAVRAYTLERGRAFTDAEERSGQLVCVLGATPRRELFGARDPIDATIRIGRLPCRVIGVLAAKGGSSLGGDQDDLVLMPLTAVQRRLSGSTDVDMIYVSASDERRMTRAKAQVQRLLRERRAVPPNAENDFAVHDMKELMRTLSTVTNVLLALLAAVAAVSLVVGGIGIMNIMLVSVTERTREIGIRLAIGALGREVLLQFLVESVVLSSLGGLIGLGLGLAGSYGICAALGLHFEVVPWVVLLALSFSTTIGVAFGYFPARRAARLDPIQALRRE